jgi:hypothetical protein
LAKTRQGDEALWRAETFWRNRRWSLLFRHTASDLQEIEMRAAF